MISAYKFLFILRRLILHCEFRESDELRSLAHEKKIKKTFAWGMGTRIRDDRLKTPRKGKNDSW